MLRQDPSLSVRDLTDIEMTMPTDTVICYKVQRNSTYLRTCASPNKQDKSSRRRSGDSHFKA